MPALLALVARVLAVVLEILGGVRVIQQAVSTQGTGSGNTAVEDVPYHILDNTTDIRAVTEALTTWELDTTDQLTGLASDIAQARLDILNAIAGLTFDTPPTPEANASAVWSAVDPLTDVQNQRTYGQHMNRIGILADSFSHGLSLPALVPEHFHVEFVDQQQAGLLNLYHRPVCDWTAVLPTDTRISWLARVNATFNWSYATDSSTVVGQDQDPIGNSNRWAFDLTEAEFQQIANIGPRGGEPVWPGIANITLGTPVAIDRTFHSNEECHGVIIAITDWYPSDSTYEWDLVDQVARAGYISFRTDNYDQADQRLFTFSGQLIMVTGMVKAAGFLGRARAGVTGSATPFTVNTP